MVCLYSLDFKLALLPCRTLGLDLATGAVQYECSMAGDCVRAAESQTGQQETVKDVLVVQRTVQTVRAHAPRSGENKATVNCLGGCSNFNTSILGSFQLSIGIITGYLTVL